MNKFLEKNPDTGILFQDDQGCQHKLRDEKFSEATRYIKSACEYVKSIRRNGKSIDNASLTRVAHMLMLAGQKIREIVEIGSDDNEQVIRDIAALVPKELCVVSVPENAIIRVQLPLLLSGKTPWYSSKKDDPSLQILNNALFCTVKDVLLGYLLQHPVSIKKGEKTLLIIKRYLTETDKKLKNCDNNNVETGAVTNAISQALAKSDNHLNMDFLYTSTLSDTKECVEITLIEEQKLGTWIPYICS